jgi:hypothetical protein
MSQKFSPGTRPVIRSIQDRAARNLAKRPPEVTSPTPPDLAFRGWLAAEAPPGASVRRVEGTAEGFRFSTATVEAGNSEPVVLNPDHRQGTFGKWLVGHDAFHVSGDGFGSVADEVGPSLRTTIAQGLIRCFVDRETGTIEFDTKTDKSNAESAVRKVADEILSFFAADPRNTVFFVHSGPQLRERASNPEKMAGFVLHAGLTTLGRSETALQRLEAAQPGLANRFKDRKQNSDSTASWDHAGEWTPTTLAREVANWQAGVASPAIDEVVDILNKAGFPTDMKALWEKAHKETGLAREVFDAKEAKTINKVWLMPASPDDPKRGQLLDETMALMNSFDGIVSKGGSVEWTKLPQKIE